MILDKVVQANVCGHRVVYLKTLKAHEVDDSKKIYCRSMRFFKI